MKPSRFLKATVLVNCAVPVALLGWDAYHGQLGANPVNFAIRTTGILTLIFLLLTLAVTPVSRITHQPWLGSFRRMLGLCAFFHGSLHFAIFFGLDRAGSVSDTLSETVKRPYLLVGMAGLGLMVPLAATSTDGMIRRLGGRNWKRLHRLVYLVAIAGAVHYYMLVKADTSQPIAFASVLGVLLGYRVVAYFVGLGRDVRSGRTFPAKAAAPRFWKGQLKVVHIKDETPDVRTFRLVAFDGSDFPFEHRPGQYLNVLLPVEGARVGRSYTIASPPTRGGSCEITVKREEHGIGSRYLHDEVREGAVLDVSAPAGRFTFTGAEADSLVLIAGGVGITPLMAKIRYLTDIGWPGAIDLIYSVRTERDIIFREELESLRQRFPNLSITITLSRDDSPAWTGERGRISPELIRRAVPSIATRLVHLCGPDEMMESLKLVLRDLGVPDDRVAVESFTRAVHPDAEREGEMPPEPIPASAGEKVAGVPSITFARSGKSAPITNGQTVLEAAEALGVDIPYDCRAGICGTCKTQLLDGHVSMDTEAALGTRDRAGNVILCCQAHCLDAVVVDA